jgi:hypothetical protein
LWNPHSFAGAPLLGNGQSALLSPFNALALCHARPHGAWCGSDLEDRDCGSVDVLDAASFSASAVGRSWRVRLPSCSTGFSSCGWGGP